MYYPTFPQLLPQRNAQTKKYHQKQENKGKKLVYSQPRELWQLTNGLVTTICMSQNDQLIGIGTQIGKIIILNINEKSQVKEYFVKDSQIQAINFSFDSQYLATSNFEYFEILLFELALESDNPKFILKGHSNRVIQIVFSPDSNYLLSGSMDKTMKIWDLQTKSEMISKDLQHPVHSINVSQNQKFIQCTQSSGQTQLFYTKNMKNLKLIKKSFQGLFLSFDLDLQTLISSMNDIKIFRFLNVKLIRKLELPRLIRLTYKLVVIKQFLIFSLGPFLQIWDQSNGQYNNHTQIQGGINFVITKDLNQIIIRKQNNSIIQQSLIN